MSSSAETKKRSISSFFAPSQPAKRARTSQDVTAEASDSREPPSTHETYPHPIASLPADLIESLNFAPEAEARAITNKPDLDLLYYKPYVPASIQQSLFRVLRAELPFYRVKYSIKRGNVETMINTPRYTTVFGVDATSTWTTDSSGGLVDSATAKAVPASAYKARPRPMPGCLDVLRRSTEAVTGATFNFCLVNYYASGDDSISYHSDDERFLGEDPAIASFSLGGKRDFLMRHKDKDTYTDPAVRDLKLELGSGDMLLMRGKTQAKWLHSVPKRKGGVGERGRINITFRKALVKGGTENYYRYNVGEGEVYRWDETRKEMCVWKG